MSDVQHLLFPTASGATAREVIPTWFTAGRHTPRTWIRNVARGLHPHGRGLQGGGNRCADCFFHHIVSHRSREHHKCLQTPETRGAATDIRVRWPACHLFKPLDWEAP